MRILTRTFPPSSNPNYGGILQAWALQKTLREMGHEVATDSTRSDQRSAARRMIYRGLVRVLFPFALLGLPVPGRTTMIRNVINSEILGFPRRHITEVALYRAPAKVDRRLCDSFDVFLVGSDQVWRPAYVDVSSFLLDFLSENDTRRRVSYAASFGRGDGSEYSSQLRRRTALLASKFDRISTRERSGIALADELWGVDAVQVPDPTLLLTPADYIDLIGNIELAPGCVTYLLDASVEREKIVEAAVRVIGKPANVLLPPLPMSVRELHRDPDLYRKPSVEHWLAALRGADLVVTDSFHGTVFALLFNRPFIVIPNEKRGRARFDDLLDTFELGDRIVSSEDQATRVATSPIDWGAVNRILAGERTRGLRFLAECFSNASSELQ